MEHATKHVLVPSDLFDRLKSNQYVDKQPNKMQSLDGELNNIMQINSASDYDKAMMYQEALKKYLSFRKQNRRPIKLDIVDKNSVARPPGEPYVNNADFDAGLEAEPINEEDVSSIVNAIPKSYRRKAGQILDSILQNDNVMRWNVNKELVYNNETIKGSNITDLLYDVLKQKGKSLEPVGWSEFVRGLARINVPEYLIVNPQRRVMIQEYKAKRPSGQDLESSFTSPSPVMYSKKGTKRKSSTATNNTKTSRKIKWDRL